MQNTKTLIFHDTFTMKSGSTRMSISMANILNADIATAIWSTNCYDSKELGYHGKIYELFHKIQSGSTGFFRMKWRFFWSRHITKNYSRVIVSNEALTTIHRVLPGTETIYYAHSLPHELFDGRKEYMSKVPFFFHEFYAFALIVRKLLYGYELRKVQKIITNSEMNKKWLEEWSGRSDIVVMYPPVNTFRYRPVKTKIPFIIKEHNNVNSVIEKEVHDYYLSFCRLDEQKRVDRIVHAFVHMPEKNLIVLYNEDDADKESVMSIARGATNIFFQKGVGDLDLIKYISSSVATLAFGKQENFWVAAIESLACGIPVISVDEWGYKETIIHGKTGVLLGASFTVYDIMNTVRALTPLISENLKENCIQRASDFSLDNFGKKLQNYLDTGTI